MFSRYLNGPAPIPTADRFVFRVPSDRNPKRRYTVDLEAHNGNGSCDCTDFQTRRWPAIRDGALILSAAAQCKHTGRCWAYIFIGCAKRIGEGGDVGA